MRYFCFCFFEIAWLVLFEMVLDAEFQICTSNLEWFWTQNFKFVLLIWNGFGCRISNLDYCITSSNVSLSLLISLCCPPCRDGTSPSVRGTVTAGAHLELLEVSMSSDSSNRGPPFTRVRERMAWVKSHWVWSKILSTWKPVRFLTKSKATAPGIVCFYL